MAISIMQDIRNYSIHLPAGIVAWYSRRTLPMAPNPRRNALVFPLLLALAALPVSCSKCFVSGNCGAGMNQAWADANINDSTGLPADFKKLFCDSLSSMQSFYGTTCSISYRPKPVVW